MHLPGPSVALTGSTADLPDAAFLFLGKETSMVSKPNLASPQHAVVKSADSAVLTAASQTIVVLLEAGRIARLPEATDISDPVRQGADLQLKQPDGSVVLIPGGAVADLVLYVGDVEIPAQTVAVLLGDLEIEVGAGPVGGAHGNFEDPAPGDIGEGFAYSKLLEATDQPAAGNEDGAAVHANQLVDEDDATFASLLIWRDNDSDRIELMSIADDDVVILATEKTSAPEAMSGAAADYVADIDTPEGDCIDLSALLADRGDAVMTTELAVPDPGTMHDVIDIAALFTAPANQLILADLPLIPADLI
jgi:hypothetical protein